MFSKLSSEIILDTETPISNIFIYNYLPVAEGNAVKVYLYGLMQSKNISGKDNTIEGFALALGMEKSEILKIYEYWSEMGLVRICGDNDPIIEYLPIRTPGTKVKKYKPEKYSDFNTQLQGLFPEKIITSNDYLRFYDVIEENKLTPEAMIMIAVYCVNLKGTNIHFNYILTVAKAWAAEGATTVKKVEEKLKEHESVSDSMRQVFYALGIKTTPEFEDRQYFLKWTNSWGYTLESVLYAATLCKKRGGIKKLDILLDNFYRMGVFTLADMQEHSKYIEATRALTIKVNKIIGVYYENIDHIVEVYTIPWLNKGFEEDAIVAVAGFCFKRSVRTLEGMNALIDKLYSEGLITLRAINEYIAKMIDADNKIREILTACGSSRMVRQGDRDMYETWSSSWGFSQDVLLYAASLSLGKAHAFAYINNVLAKWKETGLHTLEECKRSPMPSASADSTQKLANSSNYTAEELNSIFGDISDPKSFNM